MPFELDNRLKQDTHLLAEGQKSVLLLMDDARYPWLILVPKQANAREWYDLPEADQLAMHTLSIRIGHALQQRLQLDKINTATLGNVVSQLHIHIIGRRKNDPAWPAPVWGHSKATPYSPFEQDHFINLLRTESIPDWIR